MPYQKFDRDRLLVKNLHDRKNKINIEESHIPVSQHPAGFSDNDYNLIKKTAERIRVARERNSAVVLTFGAHTIKNGMSPTLIALMEDGWVTHLSTNGAGIIHDWEFAWQGKSSEDVRVLNGQFGIWDETGFCINLALIVGGL
jgi:deoxyhypusine synthase